MNIIIIRLKNYLVLLALQNLFSACPQHDWIVLNNTCYKFQNKTSNFNDARHFCTNLSSKIFEPRNNLTDENVYKSAKQFMNLNHGAWIGVVTNQTEDWQGNISFLFFLDSDNSY